MSYFDFLFLDIPQNPSKLDEQLRTEAVLGLPRSFLKAMSQVIRLGETQVLSGQGVDAKNVNEEVRFL